MTRTLHAWTTAALVALAFAATNASAQDVAPPPPPAPQTPPDNVSGTGTPEAHETNCTDRRDDDGDGLADCADADCFHADACQSGGALENTNERCSDWIDNDGDGQLDCDDDDCQGPGVTRCRGSWHGAAGGSGTPQPSGDDDMPELGANQSVEDLVGSHGDADGERTDEVCADGVDNDGDGRTDCADFGCRFDPAVTVCNPTPGLRFSVLAGVAADYTLDRISDAAAAAGFPQPSDLADVNFARLQVRVFGPIPFIQNSFFLLSGAFDKTPRLTFAMFQAPLGGGHYVNLNSGGGSLSSALIVGSRKQLLLDPPNYVYQAFEQGNGAALEVGGPLLSNGVLAYRVFAGGGSGQFNGNVGGRFFRADNTNFTYAAGAQLQVNIVGRYSRYDSPFLYTEVPLTVALLGGAKWDQRAQERYVAWNAFAIVRAWRFMLSAETYGKAEFAYNYGAESFVVQAGFLIVPKLLLFAADVGGYYPGTPTLPAGMSFGSSTIARPLAEFQYRVGLHLYLFRQAAMLSFIFTDHYTGVNNDPGHQADVVHETIFHLELQYRF